MTPLVAKELCEFVRRGRSLICRRCDQKALSGSIPLPIQRVCRPRADAPDPISNDLSRGPCLYEGESTGTVECTTCCGAVKLKTFACRNESVQEPKATKANRVIGGSVAACLKCEFYVTAKEIAARTVVGVTTTERGNPTLSRTLASLKAGGFDRVYVFSDGGQPEIDPSFDLPELEIVVRPKRLGAWSNWLLSFSELNLRHPDAARYAIIQDDVLVPRNLAAWLDRNIDDSHPVWSLFCAGAHSTTNPGWLNVSPGHGGYAYCGAQAFVVPREWSLKLLGDPGILSHKRNPPGRGLPKSHWRGDGEHHVDGAIGRYAHDAGFPVKTHYPSIVSHVGDMSSLYPGKKLETLNRKEKAFVGETYDLTNPKVACVMLSGGSPDRQHLALDAIADFIAQSYANRILVIVDNHETPLRDRFPGSVDDERIVYIRTQPTDLGSLRNLGLLTAQKLGAGLFMPWDDDDRRSPDLIQAMVSATPLGGASILRSHTVRLNDGTEFVRSWEGVNPRLPGYPGLLLAPAYFPIKYEALARTEDTRFVSHLWKWTRVVGLDLDPSLYVRRIHGNNVSPPEHFERLLQVQGA